MSQSMTRLLLGTMVVLLVCHSHRAAAQENSTFSKNNEKHTDGDQGDSPVTAVNENMIQNKHEGSTLPPPQPHPMDKGDKQVDAAMKKVQEEGQKGYQARELRGAAEEDRKVKRDKRSAAANAEEMTKHRRWVEHKQERLDKKLMEKKMKSQKKMKIAGEESNKMNSDNVKDAQAMAQKKIKMTQHYMAESAREEAQKTARTAEQDKKTLQDEKRGAVEEKKDEKHAKKLVQKSIALKKKQLLFKQAQEKGAKKKQNKSDEAQEKYRAKVAKEGNAQFLKEVKEKKVREKRGKEKHGKWVKKKAAKSKSDARQEKAQKTKRAKEAKAKHAAWKKRSTEQDAKWKKKHPWSKF